ncbi:AEC family transporter [Methylophaga sp.]|uniref:AEC family transporter n=1 Tax=Methylophaga sp. TaxID=2024840 RepID=UPI003F6A03BD
MLITMMQMGLLIAFGAVWQLLAPKHIPALAHRRALTDLVFYILLPALVLDVIWEAPIDITSMKISLIALSGLASSAILMWLVLRFYSTTQPQKGALMLAAVFPNATYLGLPVTNQVLGSWSNSVVLQFDLFACTPVLMTIGILMAHHFGANERSVNPLRELTRVPPLWAVAMAMLLNTLDVPRPEIVHNTLATLSGAVVPLMLIALGMSIRWDTMRFRFLPYLLPVSVISLIIAPVISFFVSQGLAVPEHITTAVVLLSAMPTMIFGIVICERYQLDSGIYAAAVFLTTLLSVFSLSVWFQLLPSV